MPRSAAHGPVMEIVAQITLAGLVIILVTFVAVVAWCVFEVLYEQFIELRQRRLPRIEPELDQKSEQLRSTILGLAEDLAADRDEASRTLTKAMFLTTGTNKRPRH